MRRLVTRSMKVKVRRRMMIDLFHQRRTIDLFLINVLPSIVRERGREG